MKNCNYILFILIITTTIFCIYLYIQRAQALSMQESLIELYTNKNLDLESSRLHRENRIREIGFNGKLLNKDSQIIDDKGDIKKLSDIITGTKLVLRYSELNCNTCIDEQINNLNKISQNLGIENIILLTSYEHYTYMQKFKKVNKIKFAIYKIQDELEKDLEDIGLPYYFVLNNSNFRINNTYIGMKEIPELTTTYLKHIKDIYFTDN